MRRATFSRTVAVLSLALLGAVGVVAPGCGGGGGGGGPAECTVPGTLTALALQGAGTPAGGTYGPFGPLMQVSATEGGWVAFVADVIGGTTSKGLFVARPNGIVVLVYAKDETVPNTNGGTGTINNFERIFMRPNGLVVAHVEISGGSVEGILTARVDGAGAVVEKAGAIYVGRALPSGSSGAAVGNLTAIDEDLTLVDDLGFIFFEGAGTGATPLHGIWKVSADGTQIGPAVVTGDPVMVGGTCGFNFDAIGTDSDGAILAFAVDVIGGPTEAIFATFGGGTFALAAKNGDSPPNTGGRTFDDVFNGRQLIVSFGGGATAGFVTWQGDLTGSSPDSGVFTRQVVGGGILALGSLQTIVSPGQSLVGLGAGALAAGVDMLLGPTDPARLTLDVDVAGGTTQEIFFSAPSAVVTTEIFRQGQTAPEGGTFGTTYPSLLLDSSVSVDRAGSTVLSAVLQDASTGIYWAVHNCGFFLVAKEGQGAPGTGAGVFGPFSSPSVVTSGTNVVAFPATVIGGTALSGLFRQG